MSLLNACFNLILQIFVFLFFALYQSFKFGDSQISLFICVFSLCFYAAKSLFNSDVRCMFTILTYISFVDFEKHVNSLMHLKSILA